MKKFGMLMVAGVVLALMIGVGGCLCDAGHPFYGYYSNDGRIAVEYPRNKERTRKRVGPQWWSKSGGVVARGFDMLGGNEGSEYEHDDNAIREWRRTDSD